MAGHLKPDLLAASADSDVTQVNIIGSRNQYRPDLQNEIIPRKNSTQLEMWEIFTYERYSIHDFLCIRKKIAIANWDFRNNQLSVFIGNVLIKKGIASRRFRRQLHQRHRAVERGGSRRWERTISTSRSRNGGIIRIAFNLFPLLHSVHLLAWSCLFARAFLFKFPQVPC